MPTIARARRLRSSCARAPLEYAAGILTNAVQALLFDLGGVIVGIDFDRVFRVWSRYSGVPASVIKSRFAFDASYESHERGEITARQYFASLRLALGIRISDDQFLEGWNAVFLEETPGIAALLERLRARVPLYLFSNSNSVHQQYWTAKLTATLGNFREVFVSSDLGMRKPEPAAFAAVASGIGVPCEKIRFFDDTEINVLGARSLGMQAVHFRSISDVENAVADVLAPI